MAAGKEGGALPSSRGRDLLNIQLEVSYPFSVYLNKTRRDNSRHNEGTQLETHSCLSCRGRGTLHPIALRSGLQTGWLLQRADISAGTISLWALLVVSADDIINVNDYGIIRSSYLHFISSATDVRPITRLLSRRTSSCLKVKKNISQN